MQLQRIITIEKLFWHLIYQRKASFIYHRKVRDFVSPRKFKTQMHFCGSENVVFEKFEGQKTAFCTGNIRAKAYSKNNKWAFATT
jgi:hypothetical protein